MKRHSPCVTADKYDSVLSPPESVYESCVRVLSPPVRLSGLSLSVFVLLPDRLRRRRRRRRRRSHCHSIGELS